MTEEQKEQKKEKELRDSYNKFIDQVNIEDLRIVSVKIDNLGYETLPETHSISHRVTSWYENKENKFNAFQKYSLSIKNKETKKKVATLSVTFCITFSSNVPMSDSFMEIFENSSLLINTWPYFREFTHSSFSRMGWANVIAPSFKMMLAPKAIK